MIRRFHGIDRHRRSSTVSVLNREGVEEKFISVILGFDSYIKTLGLRRCSCNGNGSWILLLG